MQSLQSHNHPDHDAHFVSFLRGSEEGFTFFFQYHYASLCIFAGRYTENAAAAEDIVEEAFLKLWERRKHLQDVKSLRIYLYRMVRNAAIDYLRHEQRKQASHAEIGRLQEKESENFAFKQVAYAELLQCLSSAMESLPSGCNKVVSMFYLEGKELQAIADEMDISVHTVKSQKARGLQLLRKKITRSLSLFFFFLLTFS